MKCTGQVESSASWRPCRSKAIDVEGLLVEAFHVVVVAHPLECSLLRFEECCGEATRVEAVAMHAQLPSAAPPPTCGFRQVVAHFVFGTLDLRRFSRDVVEAQAEGEFDSAAVRLARRRARGRSREADGRLVEVPSFVPARVWTTADSTAPFISANLQIPVDINSESAVRELVEAAERGEPQVYRILAPRQLSESEIDVWFLRRASEPVQVVSWYACPQYSVPQGFRPFVLDDAGVFYVSAIEQVASSMEMSLISARNVVNLVLDWVGRSQCF